MAEQDSRVKEKEEQKETQETKAQKKKRASTSKTQKKLAELEAKLSRLEEENAQLKEQNLRKIAEFENYKRRTEKEFLAHLEFANEELIKDLLPVLDDFERFLEHAGEETAQNGTSLKEGVTLIYKKMMGILQKKGLKAMESIGTEFDAEKHEALMQVESDTHDSGYIVDEHLKGYLLNDKVIRHSQVLVAK